MTINDQISRSQTSAMRGIAILAIVLHNYSHWLGRMVQENEYQFHEMNVRRIMVELSHPSWELIVHLLSFFGHYGVPVFVFLSAYGLVKKYESNTGHYESAGSFFLSHYKKLFMMMVVGYVAFVLVDYMTPGPRKYLFWNVVGQLGMFSNLYAEPNHDIWPGPYWYFGLMVQIYAVYRFILYPGKGSLMGKVPVKYHNPVLIALLFASLLAQLAFDPEGLGLQWYRYNVFGSLPVFIAGLLYTRHYEAKNLTRTSYIMWTIIAILLTIVLSMSFMTWILVPFCICIGTIALVKSMPFIALDKLSWVGSISAAMFVCHPIARKVIIPISRHGEIFAGLLLYLVATLVLAVVFKKLLASFNK